MPTKCSLVGQKYGNLTVIRRTDAKEDGYCVWLCRCTCGGEILVNTKRLKRGTITNCGCTPKTSACNGPIAEDLAGRKFGKLTVVSRVENRNGRTRWKCKCDCGNECIVTAHSLKNGHTRSCGCLPSGASIKDIKGKRFGRLLAEYVTSKRDRKGSVYWHCKCDCGTEIDVTEDNLVHGSYKSCGCLRKEWNKNINQTRTLVDGTCIELLVNGTRADNTSGYRGVYTSCDGRYFAYIGFKGRQYYLGKYKKIEEAIQARREAEDAVHKRFVEAYNTWKSEEVEEPFYFDVEFIDGRFKISTNIGN